MPKLEIRRRLLDSRLIGVKFPRMKIKDICPVVLQNSLDPMIEYSPGQKAKIGAAPKRENLLAEFHVAYR